MSAVWWMLVAVGFMSTMDAVAKWLAQDYAVTQVVWLRYAFGLLTLLPLAISGQMGPLRTARPFAHLVRAGFGLAGTACFFLAVRMLPLSVAVTIWFTAPIFVMLFGAVLLRERIAGRHVTSVALGLCGLVVMILPSVSFGAPDLTELAGIAAALGAATFYALSIVLTRDMSATESQISLSLYPAALGALAALPVGVASWSFPTSVDWMLFVLLGLLGSLGYLCVCLALSRERAGALTPYEYTSMIWAVGFDFLIFDKVVTIPVIAGAVIIVSATRIAATGSLLPRQPIR
jgi:S-adenosylmethionine uptake transporter